MRRLLVSIALPLAWLPCLADVHIADVATLRKAVYDAAPRSAPFEVEGVVTSGTDALGEGFALTDGTNSICMIDHVFWPERLLRAGERIRAYGEVSGNDLGYNVAHARKIDVLPGGGPVEPQDATIAEINHSDFSDRLVRFEGTVLDAFRDDTDLRFTFFVLGDGDEVAYVPVHVESPAPDLSPFIDARVSVTALCIKDRKGSTKRKLESNLSHADLASVRIVRPAPPDPFDVPPLGGGIRDAYSPDPGATYRRLAHGRVVAVWRGDRLLLQREDGEVSKVTLADGIAPPAYGDSIDAAGLPDTDLYHLNLTRARWRPSPLPAPPEKPEISLAARQLLTDGAGHRQIDTIHHGRPVRLSGKIVELPQYPATDPLVLESDGFLLPVDFSSVPSALAGLVRGSTVEVVGTCIVETGSWRPRMLFPKVEECSLAVRRPGDVRVLSRPPWWTTGRLLGVIGSLTVLLAAILAWNRVLNRVAERRGREILREQMNRAKANLKAEERTRLAVELHDSLAQSLTGAAMEVETASAMSGDAPPEMSRHLDLAGKALRSCRDELRNSLWDLRSRALEEPDLSAAIRRTLSPHMNLARLCVRFPVPRRRLSDSMAHAVLRIVRELALNGLRHGKAGSIRVAGSLEGNILRFSVSDDGRGFDPGAAPGILEGHFGLEGIRERVERFGGGFEIESAPGRGTRSRVTLDISKSEEM